MSRDLPTSRFIRTTRIGRLAAGQAVRDLGARASTIGRSEQERARIFEQRAIQAADQIVTVLGGMKGAAMKLGQMLSVIEIGVVPEAARADFQRKLAALREQAPSVSFGDMRGVLEADLGAPIGDLFAEFDECPVAAASIGQVYRARLADGRAVAVKVQYPGIATAVRGYEELPPGDADGEAVLAGHRVRAADRRDTHSDRGGAGLSARGAHSARGQRGVSRAPVHGDSGQRARTLRGTRPGDRVRRGDGVRRNRGFAAGRS